MTVSLPRRIWRVFKSMGVVGWSKKKNIFGVNPIFISTAFIFLTLGLAALLRKAVKAALGDNLVKIVILEIIATLELCASCYELIIVADNWGVEAYAFYLFILTIWWSSCWEDATACPYSPIEEWIEGTKNFSTVGLIIFSQILGGLVTFRYVQLFWAMELVETHRGKAFEDCSADLQVDMITGAIIEAVGTCLCRITSRTLSEANAKFIGVLDAFFATMMVVIAFNYSGGYFNPALATSLKLGCEGNTFVEHMVVYWIGATLGSIISVLMFRSKSLQNYFKDIPIKND